MVARLTVVLAMLGLTACGGGVQGAFTPAPMPAGGDWTGTYFSDWGRLEMVQNGDTIVGEYRSDIKHGRISGTVNGNVFRFTWNQRDDRIIGHSRALEGSGQFQYLVGDNGETTLNGTWGYGSNVAGGGVWNAQKSRSRARPRIGEDNSTPAGTNEGGEEQTGNDTGSDSGDSSSDDSAGGDSLDDL